MVDHALIQATTCSTKYKPFGFLSLFPWGDRHTGERGNFLSAAGAYVDNPPHWRAGRQTNLWLARSLSLVQQLHKTEKLSAKRHDQGHANWMFTKWSVKAWRFFLLLLPKLYSNIKYSNSISTFRCHPFYRLWLWLLVQRYTESMSFWPGGSDEPLQNTRITMQHSNLPRGRAQSGHGVWALGF